MFPCHWCRLVFLVDQLTVEHIVPLSSGGTNQDNNITLACAPCNHRHGKESWARKQCSPEHVARKRQLAREHYEQYSPKHRTEDEQEVIPTS